MIKDATTKMTQDASHQLHDFKIDLITIINHKE
jgi:hypothetical protein